MLDKLIQSIAVGVLAGGWVRLFMMAGEHHSSVQPTMVVFSIIGAVWTCKKTHEMSMGEG